MLFRIYMFWIQYLIFCNLSDETNAKAMVGQNVRNATKNEFSFIASIMRISQKNNEITETHFCTGTLISMKDVLTAEHCMLDEVTGFTRVMLGSHDLKEGVKYYILWWISYTNWAKYNKISSSFKNNDITIIRLANEIHYITPVLISNKLSYGFFGLTAVVAGWGKNEDGKIPAVMRIAEVKILTNTNCESRIQKLQGKKYPVPVRYICSAADPFVVLHCGDSGGPILMDRVLIGVSISTCPLPKQQIHPEKLNLHLVIEFYIDFINDVKNAQ